MKDITPIVFNLDELKAKAIKGDGLSSYLLGRSYFSSENGAECNYIESFKWYKYGAETLNDPKCIYGLGICYDDGVGDIKQNQQKAAKLFRIALEPLKEQAKQNDPFAMFILGAYYFYGFADIKKDDRKAFELIYNSAMLGHIAGIYDIGTFYHNATGTELDYAKSKRFLEIAASAGLERAKQKLIDWANDFEIKKSKAGEFIKWKF